MSRGTVLASPKAAGGTSSRAAVTKNAIRHSSIMEAGRADRCLSWAQVVLASAFLLGIRQVASQGSLPFCQTYLRPDGSVGDQGTLAQCIFIASTQDAQQLPYVPTMACQQRGQASSFHNYSAVHRDFNIADLSDAVDALTNGTQLPDDFSSAVSVDGRSIASWLNTSEVLAVPEDQVGGVALLDCSVIVISRESGRAISPRVGGYPIVIINGSAYPAGQPVELTAEDARLPIEVTWRLIP